MRRRPGRQPSLYETAPKAIISGARNRSITWGRLIFGAPEEGPGKGGKAAGAENNQFERELKGNVSISGSGPAPGKGGKAAGAENNQFEREN